MDINRPFETTMYTFTETPAGNGEENNLDRVTSKDSLTSLTGFNQNLSRQSSPTSSLKSGDDSRLSDASKTTVQSINNNAKTTKDKKSDHSSSFSSTPELSDRSLLPAKDQRELSDGSLLSAKDSRKSKSGHRKSVKNSANTKTQDRQSRSNLRNVQQSDNDKGKESSKQRETDTPNRESPRTPFALHEGEKMIKENQQILKKETKVAENENKLEKRKQENVPKKQLNGKVPSRLPVPCQNNNKKVEMTTQSSAKVTKESTTADRTKSTINEVSRNDTSKKLQTSNSRAKVSAVPKCHPVKDDNGKSSKLQRRTSVMDYSKVKSKLEDTKVKETFTNSREKASAAPKSHPTKVDTGKITKFQRRSSVKDVKQEKSKLQDTKAKKSFKATISDNTRKPSNTSTRKHTSNLIPRNTQTSNTREKASVVPKSHPVKNGIGKTTVFQTRSSTMDFSKGKPKTQTTEAKKSFKTIVSDNIRKPSGSSTSKQYNHPIPKTVAEAEQLLYRQHRKEDSKVNITTVESVHVADSHPVPKTVAEAERLLCEIRQKEKNKSNITTVEPVTDIGPIAGQDSSREKVKQDSALDASQIDRYFKLLDTFNENEEKIEENQRKIDLQEKELDETYAKVRNEIDNLTECTGEVVQARKVHKNFKDEAARIRVHHKTNIIAADMYEAANIDLQKQIAEIHQEITEVKAINGLKPEDLKVEIEKVWTLYGNQRLTNSSLEDEIEKLKNDLNEYKCDGDTLVKPPDEATEIINYGSKDDTNTNLEALRGKVMTGDKVIKAGKSKSADVVSLTQAEAELRETKSEHRQESRIKKIINSVRALLPSRKRKQTVPKEVDRTRIHDTSKLLQKRHQSEAENNNDYLKPVEYVNEVRDMNDSQKTFESNPFTKKPVLHKRLQQNTYLPVGSGISPRIHVPRPPLSPRPETARGRNLRATTYTLKHIYKP